jgi:predicted dehydrogenase
MTKTRIGFVGVGFMGQMAHLRNYMALPNCEVVAIAEPREKLRQAVAARYGIAQTFTDHAAMMKECQLDGLVASQPYPRHIKLIPEILANKIPVFTEKPIAVSVSCGEEMAACAQTNKTLYMVGYHKRSDPAMEYAQTLIRKWKESGEAGEMKYVRATMPPGDWVAGGAQGIINTDDPYPQVEMEAQPADMNQATFDEYNAFVNYYIHQVNTLRFLVAEPYCVKYASPCGVLMVGESQSGITITLEMAPYETHTDWQESYLVGFRHGYIKVELPAPLASQEPGRVTVMLDTENRTETYRPFMPKRHAMLNQAANFVAAVRKEKQAPCEAAEAVEDLKVAREYIRLKCGK